MTDHHTITFDRHHPFLAAIKERYLLNKPGSMKQTYHIALDMAGSGIQYHVGDSVGVIPRNSPALVERTLQAVKATGGEQIHDKRTNAMRSFAEHLTSYANITRLNKNILAALLEKQTDPSKQELLATLLSEGHRVELTAYLHSHELWDLLLEHPQVAFLPQELADLLPPILPRFYSIASSRQVVGEEVHLTVAVTEFEANAIKRSGVGSHFLCHLSPVGVPCIPTYLQSSNGFTLPSEEHAHMIMVGPGTGIAPFRGFMQERLAKGSSGKNWLFFGEWNKDYDFLYDDFWSHLQSLGKLRLDCAFSRDQSEKVYVQHKMLEQAVDIWRWLEEGAYFYVCGDADRMAKEVDQVLHKIVIQQGGLTEESAKSYLKKMKSEKRYLRDVY